MRQIITMLVVVMLAGCSGKQKFKCPHSSGGSCLSSRKISKLIAQGDINENQDYDAYVKQQAVRKKTKQRKKKHIGFYPVKTPTFAMQTLSNPATRVPEEAIQVWLAPFESKGVYHQAHYINVVVKDGHWVAPVIDGESQ